MYQIECGFALHESYLKFPLKFFNIRFGIDIFPISISTIESGPPMQSSMQQRNLLVQHPPLSHRSQILVLIKWDI